MATAYVEENFPKEAGIYDLNNFLGALNLLNSPELEFKEESIILSDEKSELEFRCSPVGILTKPEKEIKMPTPEITFELKADDLKCIRKASVLGHKIFGFCGSSKTKKIRAKVCDPNDSSSNSYYYNVGDTEFDFEYYFSFNNFKFIEGNYKVEISQKRVSHWISLDKKIEYWLAMEVIKNK